MNLPLNIDWQQILLHLLNFSILSFGLYLLLYNPIKKFMDSRAEEYRKIDIDAEQKLKQAEELKVTYRELLNNLEAEIEERRKLATQEIEKESEAILQKAKLQAEEIIKEARSKAISEREQILEETKKEITSIAIAATEKLLEQSASETLDEFLCAVKKE